MALFETKKLSKTDDKNLLAKTKKQTVSSAIRKAGGVGGAVKQMIAHAETKLDKYKNQYVILRTSEEIESYLETCKKDVYCAIDTETTGLDVFTVDLVGVCLYSESNKPAYIPIAHKSYITGVLSKNQAELQEVKKYLSNCEKIKWVMHNADYDIRILRHTMGLYLTCYWDTLIGAKVLDENQDSYSLKELHIKYCNSQDSEALSFNSLFNGVTFDNIPIETAYLYAAGDGIKTLELFKYQKAEFEKKGNEDLYSVFLNVEMPIVNVVADMEDTGIAIDFEIANRLTNKYQEIREQATKKAEKVIAKYQQEIDNYNLRNTKSKLSNPISLSSPTQLAILFYDILGLTSPDKKSPRGTGEDILKEFANGKEKEICGAILELRGVEKLLNTYIEKMPELAQRDGRVHCNFNQLGAKTGRFSSNSPNLQNIPSHNKEIRTMFKATDGYKLISCDYSKQEVFIAASVSGDEAFIESCKNSLKNNTDIYSEIASMIYNLPYDECVEFRPDGSTNYEGKERRGNAKAIVLSILYSKGVNSIAQDLKVSTDKAQAIYNGVLKAFPKLEETIKGSQETARKIGYVETAWGTRRHLPDMQLEPYEFTLIDGVPLDFDPLCFDNVVEDLTVPKKVKENYTSKLDKAFGVQKKNAIIQQAKEQGIKIKNNGGFIAQAERQCLNSRIQGSASNVTKVAMILISKDKRLKELGLRLLIPVHDELIAEAPAENIEEASQRMAELMIKAGEEKICVPMKVDIEITDNWYLKG